jgi:hypothetical protein
LPEASSDARSQACPGCGKRDTLTVTPGFAAKPLGTFSLAGMQPKVAASMTLRITCDQGQGGCGWTAPCHLDRDGKHIVVDHPTSGGDPSQAGRERVSAPRTRKNPDGTTTVTRAGWRLTRDGMYERQWAGQRRVLARYLAGPHGAGWYLHPTPDTTPDDAPFMATRIAEATVVANEWLDAHAR